jgi:hypothetical protein
MVAFIFAPPQSADSKNLGKSLGLFSYNSPSKRPMQQRLKQMLHLALRFALLGAQPLESVDDIVSDEPLLSSSGHAFLQPPHKIMRLSLPNHSEPKPFVEPSRRMVNFDNLQFDRDTPVVGLAEQGSDQLRSDPTILMVWCDLDDPKKDAVFLPLNRDAADRFSVALDDLASGGIEAVAKVLGLPLFVPTPGLLDVGPHCDTV